jgi:cellulose synthase/poly-beta-1,6-N-acetylglucosamine synthase-like glycosyltransferase
MGAKYFTTSYIYIYSFVLALIDTLTLSRDNEELFNYEVFCGRVIGIFSYWLIVKNLAGLAERKGGSYTVAMIAGIIGLPMMGYLVSSLIPF